MGPRLLQSIGVATSHLRGRRVVAAALATLCILASSTDRAKADAGGLSFWLPGAFGSLAAAPGVPGWAYSTIYLHVQESAQGKEFVKGSSVVAGLSANADAVVQGLTYTFATPVLGGQAAISVLGAPGNVGAGIDATLTGPRGNTVSGSATDNRTTFADVFYQGTLKWNQVFTTRWSMSPEISRVAPTIPHASPISALASSRWMAASATPISISPATNFPPSEA